MNSNNNNRGAECNYVVTIGREFGCGAREIGKKVAERLGIPYYDKELLTEAAKSSGVRSDVFEQARPCAANLLSVSSMDLLYHRSIFMWVMARKLKIASMRPRARSSRTWLGKAHAL